MIAITIAMMSFLPGWQDGASNNAGEGDEGAEARTSPDAEALRSRVHKLRMDLLLGGDKVQRAESEAIEFYSERLELIDRRLDRIDVDLSEKRASYQLALGRTVESSTDSSAGQSIREASRLRAEIVVMENEAAGLQGNRTRLTALIDRIADRSVDREALAANLEANNVIDFEGGLAMSPIGFRPEDSSSSQGSPFDDPQLVEELVALDPRRGRTALFDADPEGYWRFFGLRPPRAALREALKFPLPDLPGKR